MSKALLNSGRASAVAALLFAAGACSSHSGEWQKDLTPKVYRVAQRQLPPPAVYNRLRWVHPPELLPPRRTAAVKQGESIKRVLPVIHLKLEHSSLEEAALVLAAASRYTSYCAGTIAHQQISVDTLGTIDELAEHIERAANIKVVIDHQNREVRFLSKNFISPEFY